MHGKQQKSLMERLTATSVESRSNPEKPSIWDTDDLEHWVDQTLRTTSRLSMHIAILNEHIQTRLDALQRQREFEKNETRKIARRFVAKN